MDKFKESLSFSIDESTMNEDKRTVRVCALAPCLSRNNRYYSPEVVESVSGKLKGKKSYADHDERDTKNLIGKIVGESFKEGKQYVDIKVSKAKGIASQTWEKIKDGTIDSVSIAANGNAKPMEMNGEVVAAVTELDINSVDFVPEGGVPDAKVMRVFESVKDIPEMKEVKDMVIENVEQLKKEYPDLVKQVVEEMETKVKEAEDKASAAEAKLVEKEVAAHKEAKISEADVTDKVKEILKARVTGKTVAEVDESLKTKMAYAKELIEASAVEAKIEGITDAEKLKEVEKKKVVSEDWTSERIMKEEKIPENLKGLAIEKLWAEGSKAMVAYLATLDVKV